MFGPILDGLVRVEFNSINEIRETLKNNTEVAAILLEPVQGEGGIIPVTILTLKKLEKFVMRKYSSND